MNDLLFWYCVIVYAVLQYAEQRKDMLQKWADKVDEWILGENL